MRRLKLVIDCRMINMGGIGTYLRNILPALVESGKFSLICLGYDELKEFEWFEKIVFIRLRSKILSLAEHFELSLKIPKCDLIWSPNLNVPFFPIRARNRVVTIHDLNHLANKKLFSKWAILLLKLILLRAISSSKAVITVSDFSRREILKYTSCKDEKIRVCHLAVDNDFASKFRYEKIHEEYLLFVGNVKPHKNLEIALQAFSLIENKSLKFYIVGKKDGFITGYKNLDKLINGLDERVVFTGEITDEELKNYYANARLFVFPSKYEGFGLPLLEAMKFHLPIVASTATAIPEIGGSGICYFDPDSATDLAMKIDAILENKICFDYYFYDKHLKQFNWKNTAKMHELIFNEIA